MSKYIGRFAPSPTGYLHLGSLYTAVASYLDAKHQAGDWLVRIEDLDPPREQIGASDNILRTLKAHGLIADAEIMFQSQRHTTYQKTIDFLHEQHHCFACDCSRQELQIYGDAYPGTCREKNLSLKKGNAIRLIANSPANCFTDRLLGFQRQKALLENCSNDFVICRKEGLYAYQLAVVIDDIDQGITDIVRGNDILESTFKQAYLYQYLGNPMPSFLHLPVLNNANGQKLSKQNLAKAIDNNLACTNLLNVLSLLNQVPPPKKESQHAEDILSWAIDHWDIQKLSKTTDISYSTTTDIN